MHDFPSTLLDTTCSKPLSRHNWSSARVNSQSHTGALYPLLQVKQYKSLTVAQKSRHSVTLLLLFTSIPYPFCPSQQSSDSWSSFQCQLNGFPCQSKILFSYIPCLLMTGSYLQLRNKLNHLKCETAPVPDHTIQIISPKSPMLLFYFLYNTYHSVRLSDLIVYFYFSFSPRI